MKGCNKMCCIIHRQVKIRIVVIGGKQWYVLADICRSEHLSKPADLSRKLPAECTILYPVKDSKGRLQEMRLISLDGLYLLLGTSLIEKIAEGQKMQEEISQKNEVKKHQMKSVIKTLLDIWE